MKRILTFLILVLALIGCKKGDKISFNESDLFGYWACTKSDDEDNPPYSAMIYQGGARLAYGVDDLETDIHDFSWTLDGNNMIFSGESGIPKFVLNRLNALHLEWTLTFDDGVSRKDSYININRLMPGNWKCTMPNNKTYDVTFKDDMTSAWVLDSATPTDPIPVEWGPSIAGNGRLAIVLTDDPLQGVYAISSATESRVECINLETNDPVHFTKE